MADSDAFSLDRFEALAYARRHEEAARELLKLLVYLNATHGHLAGLGQTPSGDSNTDERDVYFASRIASAVAALFSDPDFRLSETGFLRFIPLQRLFTKVFGASAFATGDYIINLFNKSGTPEHVVLDDKDLLKFCLLYSLDSNIQFDLDSLWKKNRRLASGLFLALLSSDLVATGPAHEKREVLLGWMPSRLAEVALDDLPLEILHDVWMYCSYAGRRDKHEIKRALNRKMREKLLASGIHDVVQEGRPKREKPIALCIVEWFQSNHSVYRVLSLSLEALKARYRVVGISLRGETDDASAKAFDELHVVSTKPVPDMIAEVREIAHAIQPDLAYFLSVGMFPETIFLANLRLAPIQMVGIGHSASTFSDCMDYFLVEEDYIGDPACFSERVVALPKESSPYRPPFNAPVITPAIRKESQPVRIAVPASLMKFNPRFLNAVQRVLNEARVAVEFHFFPLGAVGLSKIYLQNVIRRFVGNAGRVYPHAPYGAYLEQLNCCHMFINPFPFGNMNGIVDAVRLGLAGVCWTGPEVHSHIDEGMFRRLKLPEWLITESVDEYVRAAIRLAENFEERLEISRQLQQRNPDSVLFEGDPRIFADTVEWLDRNHGQLQTDPARVIRMPRS